MGHAQSSARGTRPRRTLKRQWSGLLSHISLGCVSVGGDSETVQETSSIEQEDFSPGEHGSMSKQKLPLAYTAPEVDRTDVDAAASYLSFLKDYPEYRSTWILDKLRQTDYSRLERSGETYVDFMGGALYPESLIRIHVDFLSQNIMGNTHSMSNSSKLSLTYADQARATVLSFFKAPPEYTVIFTANATAAFKLVAESFPFVQGSSYVLGTDSHNSLHGIREFAISRGARTCYVPSVSEGPATDEFNAKSVLFANRPRSRDITPSLYALTGVSNITNCRNSPSTIEYAASLGYYTLLDAAALAPTSAIDLEKYSVDAMAVSFYKMFGYPTGVGALIVKRSFLERLRRPWFAGGTVDVVQVPGILMTPSRVLHEQFEDGTINYLNLPAITEGLHFLSAYLPFLPLRLSCLIHYLISSLSLLRHDTSGTQVVRILSRLPQKRLRSVGEEPDTGSTVSLLFLSPDGGMIPNSFIEYAASKQNISLRTGCMCNPGGAAAILGIQDLMNRLFPGVTREDFEDIVGRELGVVRISLGLASNFQDVRKVVSFATLMSREQSRQALWDQWVGESAICPAI